MLELLRGNASDRKLRLFALACCGRISSLIVDARSRQAIQYGEAAAEWPAPIDSAALDSRSDHNAIRDGAFEAASGPDSDAAATAICTLPGGDERFRVEGAIQGAWCARRAVIAAGGDGEKESACQCSIVRCLVGTVAFRRVGLDSAWLTSTVTQLAKSIHEERAFDRLPILADALEDAGCPNADILNHCRASGEHARGCWVIDLLLDKH
jgi:hypothetical protein